LSAGVAGFSSPVPFDFPGAWLYSAGHPVLHLNDISQTDKQQRPDSGVIDHVAFGPMREVSEETLRNGWRVRA